MSQIIVQLQDDHTNMSRILDLIEQEMTVFDSEDIADFRLLQEIMDYCLDYPEACHHPKEDAIYAVMVSRQPKLEVGIADLIVAHDTVGRLMRDETMSRDLILSIFGGFLKSYRMHIRLEEDNLFPEALRLLSDGDWEEVAWNFVQRANPLHDSNEQSFATLRHGMLWVFPDSGAAKFYVVVFKFGCARIVLRHGNSIWKSL